MIRVALADLLLLAAGNGFVMLVAGRARAAFGIAGRVGISFLAGVALLALTTTLLAVTGLPVHPLPFVAPVLLALALAGVFGLSGQPPWRSVRWVRPSAALVGEVTAAVAAVAVGARALVAARRLPVGGLDEYAIWGLRGRLLYLAGRFDIGIGFNAQSGYQHPDYPLALPALIAWSDAWVGVRDDAAAHMQVALIFAAMLLIGGWVGARFGGVLGGLAAVTLLAGIVGALSRHAVLLYADVPVAAYAVALLAVLAVWIDDGDDRLLGVAALLAAGAALTKNEGALAVAAVLGAAVVANLGRRRRWRPLLLVAAGAAMALAPWIVFTRSHGVTSDVANGSTLSPSGIADNLGQLGDVARGMRELWPGISGFALVLPAAAAIAALLSGRWRLVVLVVGATALSIAGLALIYLGEPNHVHSSADRTLMAPAAMLAIAIPILAGAAMRARPPVARAAAAVPATAEPWALDDLLDDRWPDEPTCP